MQVGLIGLGRMGLNMTRRLVSGGHEVIAFDLDADAVRQAVCDGAVGADSIELMVERLDSPRVVWLMLPAGEPVRLTVELLADILDAGDIVVDGGNSRYSDDFTHADTFKAKKIHYLDAGVSGGIWGLTEGYCIMIGGAKKDYHHIEPLLKTLTPADGYLYCGPTGAGHFVKMVHNGIEYAMMEAYGEGYELLKSSPYAGELDMAAVSKLWNTGSVIRSWLLELIQSAFENDPELADVQGYVQDSGEGRWTVEYAVEAGVSVPCIANSLFKRFQSRQEDVFSDRVIAALRREFGGHPIKQTENDNS